MFDNKATTTDHLREVHNNDQTLDADWCRLPDCHLHVSWSSLFTILHIWYFYTVITLFTFNNQSKTIFEKYLGIMPSNHHSLGSGSNKYLSFSSNQNDTTDFLLPFSQSTKSLVLTVSFEGVVTLRWKYSVQISFVSVISCTN